MGKFVNDYDKKKNELNNVKAQIDAISGQIDKIQENARNSVDNMKSSLGSMQSMANQMDSLDTGYKWELIDKNGNVGASSTKKYSSYGSALSDAKSWQGAFRPGIDIGSISQVVSRYAHGIASVKEDEIALVGDDPNLKELAIGANFNKKMGVPMSLPKGTGIVPSKETNTFTRMLTGFLRGGGNNYSRGDTEVGGMVQNFSIDRIVLEGVNSPNELAEALATQFKNYTVQHT